MNAADGESTKCWKWTQYYLMNLGEKLKRFAANHVKRDVIRFITSQPYLSLIIQ